MSEYQYKTVPMRKTLAPKKRRGQTYEQAVAEMVGEMIQEHARDGWEFYRADSFIAPIKEGWFSKKVRTEFNVLIFRRGRRMEAPPERESQWRDYGPEYEYDEPAYVEPTPRHRPAPRRASYPEQYYEEDHEPLRRPVRAPMSSGSAGMHGGGRGEGAGQSGATRTADRLRNQARAARGEPPLEPGDRLRPDSGARTVTDPSYEDEAMSMGANIRIRPNDNT